jgi:hypothetical protein
VRLKLLQCVQTDRYHKAKMHTFLKILLLTSPSPTKKKKRKERYENTFCYNKQRECGNRITPGPNSCHERSDYFDISYVQCSHETVHPQARKLDVHITVSFIQFQVNFTIILLQEFYHNILSTEFTRTQPI